MKRACPFALVVALIATPALAQSTPTAPPVATRNPGEIILDVVLEAGYAYQSLDGIPINAASFNGLIAADLGSWGVGLQFEAEPGRTDGGLSTLSMTLGSVAEAHVGRFRIGGGVRAGGITINRVTTYGSLGLSTLGVFSRFSVDVLPFGGEGGGALFVVAKGSLDESFYPLYCFSAGVGVRF